MNQFGLIPGEWYVHPCFPRSKEPKLNEWQNVCQPMASDSAFEWTQGDNNIGIVAGKSGLVVVDIDPRNGGDESALTMDLPDTVQTNTPTGGRHLFYLQPHGEFIGNPKSGYDGIDIKGVAGYVIAPGSIHPNGGEYVFADGKAPGQIDVAPCPKWLADLRFKRTTARTTDAVETEVVEGSRNDALTSLAGTLQRQGLSGAALEAALLAENEERCNPPLSESEVVGIANSVGQYDHDKQRPTTSEYAFDVAISELTLSGGKPAREAVYRRMLTLDDDVYADHLLQDITDKVKVKRTIINKEWKVVKGDYDKKAKIERRRESEGAADDLANAVADMVVMPVNADKDPEPLDGAFVIQKTRDGGKYMYPFWNDSRSATADVSRTLYQVSRELGNGNIDIAEQHLGNNAIIREARTRLELRVQTNDGIKHVVCSPGPFWDAKTQEFHTISDLSKGVIIFRGSDAMRGARIVETGPKIEERPEAYEKFKAVCGSNWEIILAHCISALVKIDDAKHGLIISAPRNSGKSTLAKFIAHLIDGKANMINGTDLKGLWPMIFSSRSIIFDNMDSQKSFNDGDMQTLIGAMTAAMTTVEARFTKSGITAELGFCIFTTILSDPFQYHDTLMDRSIHINHEYNEALRDFGDAELKALADEFRPHLWHMIMKYVASLPALPKAPGGIRQKCFASAAYWLRLQDDNGYTEAEADEYVQSFKYERVEEEESDPFTTALNNVIANEAPENIVRKTAGEIVKLMIYRDNESCQNIKVGRDRVPLPDVKGQGRVFKQRFDHAAAGDHIAGWRFSTEKDRNKQTLYTFYRDTS